MVEIWHNPKCSKSCASLELVENSKHEYSIVKYLDENISFKDIKDVLQKLGLDARSLMRTKEDLYKELNLSTITDEEELIDIMCQNPKLIERPIIIRASRAVIGRPIENTIELLCP